jgi:cysteinyl-tRNA synthetase
LLELEDEAMTDSEVLEMIEQRVQARANRDWDKADEIRLQLERKGIVLEDRRGGTVWKRK